MSVRAAAGQSRLPVTAWQSAASNCKQTWHMPLSADLWPYGEHSNTLKRTAAVLLGTSVDKFVLDNIMEGHKTMILITSSSMTELWCHL